MTVGHLNNQGTEQKASRLPVLTNVLSVTILHTSKDCFSVPTVSTQGELELL
jgi:hypothetical protein